MPKIAACLIVKNAEATLEACLDTIRLYVDEINLYDTGSTDGTLALVDRLRRAKCWIDGEGATRDSPARGGIPADWAEVPLAPIRVQQGEWRDDFAWAREQSFAMCSDDVDWIVWLDDDDHLEGAEHLRALAANAPAGLHGYVVFYDYARDDQGTTICQLWRERMLRRDVGYVWKGAVHEVLVPPEGVQAALVQVPAEQLRYVHRRDLAGDRYPDDRNLRILLAEKERCDRSGEPTPPRTLAYIGTELLAKGAWADAAPYLDAYLSRPDTAWSDERQQIYHKLSMCLRMLGEPHAAVEAEFRALRERDDWAENAVGLSQAFAALGEWPRAERWARRALELGMPHTALILNPLEFSLLPLVTVADACANQGNLEGARDAIAKAATLFPGHEYVQARAAEIGRAAYDAEVTGALLFLREVLVRHDENLKAHHLLENAPYFVAERPEVVKARADQRQMVAHYLKPGEYRRWYADEPKESTVPDDKVETIGDYIPRAARLLEGLREQEAELGRKPEVIDLGCNDAWMAAFLWKNGGYRADGVELNIASVEKAAGRRERFGFPGTVWQGDLHDAPDLSDGKRYDAVSMFEVLEHVPDVARTLTVCEKLLRPGGRVYVTTPNGAYERGSINGWAQVERKGHLRALPAAEFTGLLLGRGDVVTLELQHDDRLTFAAYRPRRRKSRVVFHAAGSWEPWSPASIREGGLGGSETALVQVAVRLAQAGHEVKVYSGAEPGLYAGALFRPHTAFDPGEACDLLVSSRHAALFDEPLAAEQTALWCHDHSYPGVLTEERAARIDHVVTLSEWQRERFARLYPFLDGKLRIIRNGVTLRGIPDGDDRYPDAGRGFDDRKPRCVYSSSADRGLDVLLELWPRIRADVPDAELHVFYGWNVFDRVATFNPNLALYKQRVFALADAAGGEEGGVFMRGRVGQPELAAEMMAARAWTYPTGFLETSCIGAMEARAAGLPIVTSDLGALRESVGAHGVLIAWGAGEDEPFNQTDAYRDAFVQHTVALLTNPGHWQAWHERARRGGAGLDWGRRVADWEALIPASKPAARGRKRARVAV